MLLELGLMSCIGFATSEIYKLITESKKDNCVDMDLKSKKALYEEYPMIYSNEDEQGVQIATNYYIQNNKKFKDAMYLNSMIIGSPGSWKSTIGIYPNLLNKNLRGTIVVNDPKGEFYENTAFIQRSFGRKVKRISFDNIQDKINVLRELDDEEDVFEFAKNIMINGLTINSSLSEDSTTWINLSASLLTAILLYVKTYKPKDRSKKTDNISEALLLIQLMQDEFELENMLKENQVAYKYYLSFKAGGTRTQAKNNILLNINSALAIYLSSTIREVTSETTFDLNDIRNNEYAIYISADKIGSKKISPVIAPIIQLILNKSIELANNKNALDVHFFLDEFGNMGKITGLEQYLTMMRAYRINIYFVLQSFNQLNNSYTESEISAIMSGIAHVLFLNNNREQSTVSKLLEMSSTRKQEVVEKEVDSEGNLLKIKTKTIDVKTISEGEASCIKQGEGILISGAQDVLKIKFNRWFEEGRFLKYKKDIEAKIMKSSIKTTKFKTDHQVESIVLNEYRDKVNKSKIIPIPKNNITSEAAVTREDITIANDKQKEEIYKITMCYKKFMEQNFN